jgi:hypothetical protein
MNVRTASCCDEGFGNPVAVRKHPIEHWRDEFDLAEAFGEQQYAEDAEQRQTLADGSLAATTFIHQDSATECVCRTQCLGFAFVEVRGSRRIDVVIAPGVDLSMGLHEIRNGAGARAVRCRLIEHGLRHMDGIEDRNQQIQLAAGCQCHQRAGVGDDDRPGHCAASKAASSCSRRPTK